eukprot:Nk52_evm119s224 gene=Nk52_evmTU119s224
MRFQDVEFKLDHDTQTGRCVGMANFLTLLVLVTYVFYHVGSGMQKYMQHKAWEASSQNEKVVYDPGFYYRNVYLRKHEDDKNGTNADLTLLGKGVGWNWQGMHQSFSHWPGYMYLFLRMTLAFLPMHTFYAMFCRLRYSTWCAHVSDDVVCSFVMETVLALGADVEFDESLKEDILVMSLDPREKFHNLCAVKEGTPVYQMLEKGVLLKIWPRRKVILSAKTLSDNKDIEDALGPEGRIITSRNALLLACMREVLANFSHVKIHCLCEISAREISAERIAILEPSSRFVLSLNEGLLNSPLSPALPGHVLSVVNKYKITKGIYTSPNPDKHKLGRRKLQLVPHFEFLLKARSIIFRLVGQFGLKVNTEALFSNLILHYLDHHACFKAFTKIQGGISFDGTGSVTSYWKSFVFGYLWNAPVPSIFSNELISQQTNVFYQALYEELCIINKPYADILTVSCSY